MQTFAVSEQAMNAGVHQPAQAPTPAIAIAKTPKAVDPAQLAAAGDTSLLRTTAAPAGPADFQPQASSGSGPINPKPDQAGRASPVAPRISDLTQAAPMPSTPASQPVGPASGKASPVAPPKKPDEQAAKPARVQKPNSSAKKPPESDSKQIFFAPQPANELDRFDDQSGQSGKGVISKFKPAPPKLAPGLVIAPVTKGDGSAPVTAPGIEEVVVPTSDESFEPLESDYRIGIPLERRQNSQGEPLIRVPVLAGSYKANVARILLTFGYKPVWEGAPSCLDWTVESNYVVQSATLQGVLQSLIEGYPVKVTIFEPNKIVNFKVEQLYRLECQ